jgi:hypothetical protein
MTQKPRAKRVMLALSAGILCMSIQAACRPLTPVAQDHTAEASTMMGYTIPDHVRRLAIWHPRTSEQTMAYGYSRLEQAAFQLKKQRAWIKIVERRTIEPLTDEQRLQVSGRIADETAMHVGRWLGADSMVLFQIEGPTWRERMLARFHEHMPPFVVSSRIISVESGEVLYHDIVTAVPIPRSGQWSDYWSDYELQPALRSALDHAVSMAIAHLEQSFR